MPKPTTRPIADLAPDPINARTIDEAARAGLGVSLERFGDLSGIVQNKRNGLLVAGHQRMAELRTAGAATWRQTGEWRGEVTHPKTGEVFGVRIVDWDDETHRLANLSANNPEIQGTFTDAAAEQLAALEGAVDYGALRLDALAEQLAVAEAAAAGQGGDAAGTGAGSLADRFLVPPFSVLDARQGYWQDRKRAWLALGIKSELGRVAPIGGGADAAGSSGGGQPFSKPRPAKSP